MIPSLVPDEIVALHRALLKALHVDYFPPGMGEMNNWRNFLFVMQPLEESEGGPFTEKDIGPAIALMRADNKRGLSNWSLRFFKIMNEPESFRDIVLIARKALRKRPPIEQTQRTDATGANIAIERDPAAERDPVAIAEGIAELRRKLRLPAKDPEKNRQD